jgi:hypothetical protein
MQQLESICIMHSKRRQVHASSLPFFVAAAAGMTLLLGATEAHAEPPASDTSALAAQGLFDSGLALMDAKKYAEACPKFAESQKLAPAGGTLMNLALCREKEGRYATALLAYDAALAQAIKDKHAARQAFAREHQAAVKNKVSKLTLVPGWTTGDANPIIELDSTELAASAVGIALPLDSGSHRVAVKLAGKKPRTYDVDLAVGEARDLKLALPSESADEVPSELTQATGTVFGTGGLGVRAQTPTEPAAQPTAPRCPICGSVAAFCYWAVQLPPSPWSPIGSATETIASTAATFVAVKTAKKPAVQRKHGRGRAPFSPSAECSPGS